MPENDENKNVAVFKTLFALFLLFQKNVLLVFSVVPPTELFLYYIKLYYLKIGKISKKYYYGTGIKISKW